MTTRHIEFSAVIDAYERWVDEQRISGFTARIPARPARRSGLTEYLVSSLRQIPVRCARYRIIGGSFVIGSSIEQLSSTPCVDRTYRPIYVPQRNSAGARDLRWAPQSRYARSPGSRWVRKAPTLRATSRRPIDRGDVVAAVTATGVLHPLTQVDVGSEVSGVIRSVNVDFNDRVTKGQILARLDTAQLQARVLQTQASLESAAAGRRQAEATTHEAQLNFHRCERLAQTQMCSQQDLDQVQATWLRAQAAEAIATAQVSQAKANLDADQTALRKADIVSPIDGIVLNRFVEPGQTVAATFQTPLLFTLGGRPVADAVEGRRRRGRYRPGS